MGMEESPGCDSTGSYPRSFKGNSTIHRKAWISAHRRCKDCKSYPCNQGAKVYNSTHHLDQPEGQGDAVATGEEIVLTMFEEWKESGDVGDCKAGCGRFDLTNLLSIGMR
jgi:hypothetical protein